ncbi:MAG: adenine deaminase [Actinobacteria bacterium]|nr:adenine deaminase [Actinomycetota bacterium]
MIDVFSGAIVQTGIALHRGRVAGLGDYDAAEVIDLEGRFVCPGFIDGHIHVESTMLTPPEFARAVIPLGTTAVVIDPHEIANVLGEAGIEYMLESSHGLPVTFYVMLPSCVPTTAMETAGARLDSAALARLIGRERVIGIAEMMDYPGVLAGDPEVMAKLAVAGGRRVDGHAPGLSGKDLAAYAGAGISSEHECVTAAEALEKLRAGMHIHLREGSTARNLRELIGVVDAGNSHHFSLVTDDRHPGDLLAEGHINYLVRLAIGEGVPPVTAIRMATLNTAVHYGLDRVGAVAPGYAADLLVLDDLKAVTVSRVFKDGREVARDGRAAGFDSPAPGGVIHDTVNIDIDSLEDLGVPAPAPGGRLRVIGIVPQQIVTEELRTEPLIENGLAVADPGRDILKLTVIERHHASGNVGIGFVHGLGLKSGALASTVAHDSHNIIAAGVSDDDIRVAVRELRRLGGGIAVAAAGEVLASLALPVAGLMSDRPVAEVAAGAGQAIAAAAELGCILPDPFITMSFLALPVVPKLKLTDRGLVDVEQFRIVELFVQGRADAGPRSG